MNSFDHIRHSGRLLQRHKRFTALAVLSLGVAIALNTTMYSVVDALIRPKLEIRQPHRLYEAPYFGGWLRAFLFDEYDRYDSRIFAVAAAMLFAIAWFASWVPARRATHIIPVEALRND